jgi:hypothetical protein
VTTGDTKIIAALAKKGYELGDFTSAKVISDTQIEVVFNGQTFTLTY